MAERKGSGRFESEPRPAKSDRNLGEIPEIEAGLARAAADRWRQADGRLPDSVAHVTQRQPITHADLFPADARPSRLRMALYGTVAAVSLIVGGSALALLFVPGGESGAPAEQQVASMEPAVSAMVETASDAPPDVAPAPAPATRIGAPAPAASAAPPTDAQPNASAVDATTTGTAPQARWMERWVADEAPEAQTDAPAEEADAELANALRESLPPAGEASAPATSASPAPAAPAARVIDIGPTAEQTVALPEPTAVEPPPAVATAPAASEPSVSAAAQPEPTPPSSPAPSPSAPEPAADELAAAPAPAAEPMPTTEVPAPAAETAALPQPQGGRPGRIVSPVNLRASGERGAAILGTVAGGTELQVIACDLWCEIVTADGRRGFVFKDFVSTAQ